VAGEVVDVSSTDGGYDPYHVVTLRTENGAETDVHAFHTVLRNELARRNVQVGDQLEITYLGRVDGGRGSSGYDSYRVTGGKTPVVDWSSEAGGTIAAPAEPGAPIDTSGLDEPAGRSISELAAQSADDDPVPY
jgi:hypothetical protein